LLLAGSCARQAPAPAAAPAPPTALELRAQSAHARLDAALAQRDRLQAQRNEELSALERLTETLHATRAEDTPFLLVDIAHRRVVYYDQGRLAKVCEASVGSGKRLKAVDEEREWQFETPRGDYKVLARIKDPIWHKPDWAFIEKGEPVPPMSSPLREEKGTMGPYALDLGDGYKLHGTKEEGKIGTPVSHGCIRLETECITYFYQHVPVGTPVFMY
jgi:L,D-transpeptidase YbiS